MSEPKAAPAAPFFAGRKELDGRRSVKVEWRANNADFKRLFPDGSVVEAIAGGFTNTEGPVWMGDHLLFTDAPRNRIVRWRDLPEGPEVTTYRFPSGFPLDREPTVGQPGAMGLTRDGQGRLIACETGNRRVTRTEADGRMTVLCDRFEGRLLNRPNDVVVARDGTVFFTDPNYQLPTPEERLELEFEGVFSVRPGEAARLVARDIEFPNGLALSPDESVLYVAESKTHRLLAYTRHGDAFDEGRVFAEMKAEGPGIPDGIKVDVEGNVYCGSAGGMWVFDAAGRHLGSIVFPDWPRNMCWGDDDWRTMYVTAGTTVYRLRSEVAGIPT
jgi:gluconolactonase